MIFRIFTLLLLIFSLDIDAPPPRTVQWPLGDDVTPWRGYGQFNQTGGFHWALDFHGSEGDTVFAPYSYPGGCVLAVGINPDTVIPDAVEGLVLIGLYQFSDFGWEYEHIDVRDEGSPLYEGRKLYREWVAPLAPYAGLGSHVHFAWLSIDDFLEPLEHPGYFNPFDCLPTPYPYDKASFGLVKIAGDTFNQSGILFVDSTGNLPDSQSVIRGVMDIIIHPYTEYVTDPSNDKCGVRVVSWLLKQEDCSTLEYIPDNTLGSYRTLFDFTIDEEIPDPGPPSSEYDKIYFLPDSQYHFENAIVLTNSCDSPRPDALFEGVKTVWIDDYNRQDDYNDAEFCRGAWDTRICTFDGGEPANIDEAAAFDDGRYAIEVMAIPQKSDEIKFITLPVDSITSPHPEVTGVIVDNWAPRIKAIYLTENDGQIIRAGEYTPNAGNDQMAGRSLSDIMYYCWPYITTGTGMNEYKLEIHYSEPVTNMRTTIPVTIKMIIGPDSTSIWNDSLSLELDPSCYNANEECIVAEYCCISEQPSGYVGQQIVEMTITADFATDQAGNPLDADASTIALAWGDTGCANRETTCDLVQDFYVFIGYERGESSEQDSRSRNVYAYYDCLYYPTDDRDSLVYIPNEFTLTGSLYDAELFNEVNSFGLGSNKCIIWGGLWMCDEKEDDALHLYVVDYSGIIKHDVMFFQPDTSNIDSGIIESRITSPSYGPPGSLQWYHDRYGWLGWRTLTPEPEANRRESTEFVSIDDSNVSNVEIYYTVCDAYTGQSQTVYLTSGDSWFSTDSKELYTSTIWEMYGVGDDGDLYIKTKTYIHPETIPIYLEGVYSPPRGEDSCNSILSDSMLETGIISQGIGISDYFSVFPNPAHESVSIDFLTSVDVSSTIRVYDISGHLVRVVAEDLPGMRNHNLLWDLQDANGHIVPTGVYYVSLASDSFQKTRTVIVCH